ncbi:hypothetical protein DERP_010591 [Dermatophagoides pteronyssinus]|uniref:Uncharacterized protein n=1 Tax=Dermatophagoides pteronyssinus TaxID=6956 RepID=A0ABQ8JFS8_DERPT|nr:hypothetical protein DERP_010591 [Dermatophagoides pteronyssinus]
MNMAEIDFCTRQMALSYFPYKFIVSPIVLLPWFKSSSVTLNIFFAYCHCSFQETLCIEKIDISTTKTTVKKREQFTMNINEI